LRHGGLERGHGNLAGSTTRRFEQAEAAGPQRAGDRGAWPVGALLDPWILPPVGPIATRPERISGTFTRCGRGSSRACVVDGDTLRLGDRRVRLMGIDAPELSDARCPAERALGQRAADRLLALVNQGEFDLIGHRFNSTDHYGRDLRLASRRGVSLGQILVDEGLAHRYFGAERGWC